MIQRNKAEATHIRMLLGGYHLFSRTYHGQASLRLFCRLQPPLDYCVCSLPGPDITFPQKTRDCHSFPTTQGSRHILMRLCVKGGVKESLSLIWNLPSCSPPLGSFPGALSGSGVVAFALLLHLGATCKEREFQSITAQVWTPVLIFSAVCL